MGSHNIIFFECVSELFRNMRDYEDLHLKVYPISKAEGDFYIFFKKVNKPIKFHKVLKKMIPIAGNAVNIQVKFEMIESNELTENYNNVKVLAQNQINLFENLAKNFIAIINKLNLFSKNEYEYTMADFYKDNTEYQKIRQQFLNKHDELLILMDRNK